MKIRREQRMAITRAIRAVAQYRSPWGEAGMRSYKTDGEWSEATANAQLWMESEDYDLDFEKIRDLREVDDTPDGKSIWLDVYVYGYVDGFPELDTNLYVTIDPDGTVSASEIPWGGL